MRGYVVGEDVRSFLRRGGGDGFCAGGAGRQCRVFPTKSRTYPPPPDFDLYVGARGGFLFGEWLNFVIPAKAGISPMSKPAEIPAFAGMTGLDFRQWLAARRVRFYEGAEDAFAGALSQGAARLSFVKRARVELQTSLGGRKGAGGVDVAGALRESDDDIVGWQLRGYAAEHGTKGLNTGLFYRRVVGGALAGVNVFADYEDGDDGDFWRWSVGGDVKNRLGELSANRYFAITDAQVVGGQNTYTREGYDVDFAVRIPRLEWAKARVGYYEFKGEFGDEDENGFRAGLDLSPGDGLVLGVEYDDDDGKFGGNISYTHHFGETQQGAQRAGEFNPRAHFYDSVRREYSQRISRAGNVANGALIVASGVNVNVSGDVAFTATSFAANAVTNFAFPLTGNAVTVQTQGNGALTMRHQGGGWVLTLLNNAQVAFLQTGAVLSVASGSGTFERFGARRLSAVIMANTTLGLLGTRFDFRADGANAFVTLIDGALSLSVGGNVSVTVLDAPGPGTRVYLYDSGGSSVVVGCGAGEVRSAAGLSADCKPAIGVVFVGDSKTAPVTTTGDITIGTLQVTGGFDAQDINIVGARGDFRLANVDGMPSLRALVLGGDNNSARAATVVVRGDDNEGKTPAAMLTVTVMVVERVVLLGGGRVTVFAAADENEVVAVFQPLGGFPPYNNLNKLLPSGALPGGFQESAAAASVTITRTNTNAAAGSEHFFAYEVTETRNGGDSASATVEVTVIASLNAAIDFAGGALTAGMAATVATISAAGGIGDYAYSANNNAVSFVDGTIAVANFNNAGTISVNLIANDNAAITEPFTIVITLTALNTAMAAPDNATFREFQTGASVTLANLTYSGATGGGNVTATVITVQNGAGEVGGRELLVSSDMRGTSEVQVAVYDSANAAAPQSTLTLSLEFVAPLTAAFAGNPNFAPLTNNANIVIGTVTLSGGDGEYGNPQLQVNMQDFAWSENTILILNNTGGRNESGRTVTALIVADDNSNISEQASLAVSVTVLNITSSLSAVFLTSTANIAVVSGPTTVNVFGALTTGVSATLGTMTASGGAGGYAFSSNNGNVSFVGGTIVVANFADAGTVNVDLIGDDDNTPITEPFTIGITVTALTPLALTPPPVITLTTGETPAQAYPLFTLAVPRGGQPPYEVGTTDGQGRFVGSSGGVIFVSPFARLDISGGTVLRRSTQPAASAPAAVIQNHQFAARDSSSPPRLFILPKFTVQWVAPPSDG